MMNLHRKVVYNNDGDDPVYNGMIMVISGWGKMFVVQGSLAYEKMFECNQIRKYDC